MGHNKRPTGSTTSNEINLTSRLPSSEITGQFGLPCVWTEFSPLDFRLSRLLPNAAKLARALRTRA